VQCPSFDRDEAHEWPPVWDVDSAFLSVSRIDTLAFFEHEAGFGLVPMNDNHVSIDNVGGGEGRPEAQVTAL
jgi:hypothetical protein